MKVFYSDKMVAQEGGDSPSARKPKLVVDAWVATGIPLEIEAPDPVSVDDFALAHDRVHVESVLAFKSMNGFGNYDAEVAASLPYTTGAMLSAAREAILCRGAVAAPCSGFHHAEWDRSMMFCTFNGLMVAARKLRGEGVTLGMARRISFARLMPGHGCTTSLRPKATGGMRHS